MPLLEADEAFIKGKGYSFDVVDQPGMVHLILRDYPLPDAYVPQKVELLIRLPAGFPNAKPDMFWTIPTVQLARGGRPDRADVMETHAGRTWQRWSRHCQSWRAGIDDLQTYLTAIQNELLKGR